MRPQDVRTVVETEVLAALHELRGPHVGYEQVHAARKSIKKARAALRLLRPAISKAVYRTENSTLRDAARPLSSARDATVLVETLDSLSARSHLDADGIRPFRATLVHERDRLHGSHDGILVSRHLLDVVRLRLSGWRVEDDPAHLTRGVLTMYRDTRRAYKRADRTRSPDDLHEWRKQVKYLWHQLQSLEPLRPARIRTLTEELHDLSDLLGRQHDLDVLQARANDDAAGGDDASAKLKSTIARRREALQKRGFALGKRLFAEKPSRFVRTLRLERRG